MPVTRESDPHSPGNWLLLQIVELLASHLVKMPHPGAVASKSLLNTE